MSRVRHLGFLDGLTVALGILFLGSLKLASGSYLVSSVHAVREPYVSCQAPATCQGTSGTCTGCVPGAQVGLCSTTYNPFATCSGAANSCAGLDPTFTACNCSSNAC